MEGKTPTTLPDVHEVEGNTSNQCPSCGDSIKTAPRLLDCGHSSYCDTCFDRVAKSNCLICPVPGCFVQTHIGHRNFEDFPIDDSFTLAPTKDSKESPNEINLSDSSRELEKHEDGFYIVETNQIDTFPDLYLPFIVKKNDSVDIIHQWLTSIWLKARFLFFL
eukprot:TRINITY_DN5829_c0_g2_i3.p2 TRINITY_DN5829_c0_g2~~TRINITY_DN5829_c0_g2_i3.p2  ORF type:complete len:163 (-),score=34.38 TRINITY_DN5829_c0_g2_i3:681-1169(-)